jgi:hypothetical protein
MKKGQNVKFMSRRLSRFQTSQNSSINLTNKRETTAINSLSGTIESWLYFSFIVSLNQSQAIKGFVPSMFRDSQTPQLASQQNNSRNSQPLKNDSSLKLSGRRSSVVNEVKFDQLQPKSERKNNKEESPKISKDDVLDEQKTKLNENINKAGIFYSKNSNPKRNKNNSCSNRFEKRDFCDFSHQHKRRYTASDNHHFTNSEILPKRS